MILIRDSLTFHYKRKLKHMEEIFKFVVYQTQCFIDFTSYMRVFGDYISISHWPSLGAIC